MQSDADKALATVKRAHQKVAKTQEAFTAAVHERRSAIEAAVDAGLSEYRIAQELSMSRQAVGTILRPHKKVR